MRRLIALLLLLLVSVPAAAQEGNRVFLRLSADASAAVPGKTLRIAIEQRIVPGWHTYWTNPGDSGEPMRIAWDLPAGYEMSDLLWPAPERVPYGPLMNFGYNDHAVMLADLKVPADAEPGTILPLRGQATVLVCDEICIPENHDIAFDIPVAVSAVPANADLFAAAGAQLPQPVDWPTVTELDANEVRVRIAVPSGSAHIGYAPENIVWFPQEWGYIENAADQTASYEPETGTLTLRQKRAAGRNINDLKTAAYLVRAGDEAFIVNGPLGAATAPVMGQRLSGAVAQDTLDTSFVMLLVFAFFGGMILNLMPCVFPVLSMKALHLVSLPQGERGHARVSGLLYAAGVISMFVVLGAILLAVRAGGEQLGWGFQLQNPAVVAGLAWLMFLVGLNLAGFFDLRIAFGGGVLLAEKHHPLLSSFLTGILATLVATPCTAPFMATALGAALAQSPATALAIFAMVGVGLAFPFALLCVVPALQRLMPRPGAWMEIFRQVLAFPMFASGVWLVWVVAQQGGPNAVGWTLFGMVMLAMGIWLLARRPATRTGRHVLMLAGVAVIGLTLSTLGFVVPAGTAVATAPGVQAHKIESYDARAVDTALRETDQPVFVNMTASWCITCLVNEKVVLETPDARDLFEDRNVRYFKGDWTNRDPAITAYLQSFQRSGVPIYVYYPAPDPATGERPPATVLPQILTMDVLRTALQ